MSLDPERTQNDETPKKPGYALNDSMRSMKSAWLKGQKMVDQSFSFVGNGRFSEQPSDHSPLGNVPTELTLVVRASHEIEGPLLTGIPSTGDLRSATELYEGLDTFGAAVEPRDESAVRQVHRASVEIEMVNFTKQNAVQTEHEKRQWETMGCQGQDSLDSKMRFLEENDERDYDAPSNLPEIVLVDVDSNKKQASDRDRKRVRQDVRLDGARPSTGDTDFFADKEGSPTSGLRPAWEVDAFQWPAITSDLIEGQSKVFEQLVTSLDKLPEEAKTMAVTSLRSGDGRSVMSICIARWAAQQGMKTLLVDADFSRARLVASAGLEFGLGWQQMVTESVPIAEFLVASENVPLTIMCLQPSSITSQNRSRVSKIFIDNLGFLRPNFDLIVVDSGITRELEWLFEGTQHPADLGVFVCNLRRSEASDVLEARRHLDAAGFQHLGLAENFGRPKAA
ncbi:MAG: hypothetical protein VYC80_15015 [Planctomycetota bacterium]|nr:hypothetical protein [Planctomycetota bacterium]